ncbi:homoserine kinase [compost metagenome]
MPANLPLHVLAQSFTAGRPRPQWHQHNLLQQPIIPGDPLLEAKWEQYLVDFKQFSASRREYGLIHGDLHHRNFLVHGEWLTVIDFGDSEYHWFVYDIAVAIYHTAQTVPEGIARERFIRSFVDSFMQGYTEADGSTEGLQRLDYFINYRHLFSYTYHCLYADFGQLTKAQRVALAYMRQTLLERDSYWGFSLM